MRRCASHPIDVAARNALRLLCSLEGGGGRRDEIVALLGSGDGTLARPEFAYLVEVHGLAPWAHHALRGAGLLERLPGALAGKLRDAWRVSSLRNRIHLEEFPRIAGALRGRGVDGIALKGAALLGRVYPEPGVRPMQDIDLLVSQHSLAEAGAALEGIGYISRTPPGSAEARRDHFHSIYTHPGRGVVVELHWALADTGLLDPSWVAEIWDRAMPGPGGLLRLDPAAELAYVAVHAAKHGVLNLAIARRPWLVDAVFDPLSGNRLVWLLDVRRLLCAGAGNLREAAGRARAWGVLASLHAGVVLAEQVFGDVAGKAWEGPPPPDGMSAPRALAATALARGLARGGPLSARVLARLMRVDPILHARPVRALELLDRFQPGEAQREEWRRRHGAATAPLLWAASLGRGVAAVARAAAAGIRASLFRRRSRARGGAGKA